VIPHSRPTLGWEEQRACRQVLKSGQIAQGRKVEEFEHAFLRRTGRRYAIAVSSGTSALQLAFHALDLAPGDQVILPSYTCVALLHAVHAFGAEPVFVDIDSDDFNLSVDEVRKRMSTKTRMILVPHTFGRPARMKELLQMGVSVIEDGTQALGARVGCHPVGSMGLISIFSFYATKMMTTGEGGMVLTDSKRLARRILDSRDYDKRINYRWRTNSKMSDLEAAIGIEQLKKLDAFIAARRKIAAGYSRILQDSGVVLPVADQDRDHVFFRYVIRVPGGSGSLLKRLNSKGLEAKRPIFRPLHQLAGLPDRLFPRTIRAQQESCSLPIFPKLDLNQQRQIGKTLLSQFKPSQRHRRPLAGAAQSQED